MFRTILLLTVLFLSSLFSSAQQEAVVQEGEFGIGIGAAHYFGDLNTRAHLNRPKFAATAFLTDLVNRRVDEVGSRDGHDPSKISEQIATQLRSGVDEVT